MAIANPLTRDNYLRYATTVNTCMKDWHDYEKYDDYKDSAWRWVAQNQDSVAAAIMFGIDPIGADDTNSMERGMMYVAAASICTDASDAHGLLMSLANVPAEHMDSVRLYAIRGITTAIGKRDLGWQQLFEDATKRHDGETGMTWTTEVPDLVILTLARGFTHDEMTAMFVGLSADDACQLVKTITDYVLTLATAHREVAHLLPMQGAAVEVIRLEVERLTKFTG